MTFDPDILQAHLSHPAQDQDNPYIHGGVSHQSGASGKHRRPCHLTPSVSQRLGSGRTEGPPQMELRHAALVCPGPVTSPGRLPSPPLPPWGPAHHLLPTPSRHFGNDVKQATQHTVSNSGLLSVAVHRRAPRQLGILGWRAGGQGSGGA